MSTEAFKEHILPVKNKLFRLALRILEDVGEAEDVVQEVFLKLWKNRHQMTEIVNTDAWCMRMTKNLEIDKWRSKQKRMESLKETFDAPATIKTPFQFTVMKDTLKHIKKLMDALPEKQKLTMHLRDIEGMTYKEIADILSIPVNQVKVNLFRARKQVRNKLMETKLLM